MADPFLGVIAFYFTIFPGPDFLVNYLYINILLSQRLQQLLKRHFVLNEHFAGLGAMGLAYDTGFLEHIHQTACTVVADGELALDKAGGAAA